MSTSDAGEKAMELMGASLRGLRPSRQRELRRRDAPQPGKVCSLAQRLSHWLINRWFVGCDTGANRHAVDLEDPGRKSGTLGNLPAVSLAEFAPHESRAIFRTHGAAPKLGAPTPSEAISASPVQLS
jgi:hypothetical protein